MSLFHAQLSDRAAEGGQRLPSDVAGSRDDQPMGRRCCVWDRLPHDLLHLSRPDGLVALDLDAPLADLVAEQPGGAIVIVAELVVIRIADMLRAQDLDAADVEPLILAKPTG